MSPRHYVRLLVSGGCEGTGWRIITNRSVDAAGTSPRAFIAPERPRHAGTTCGAPENTSVVVMAIRMAANTSCGSLPASSTRWENSGATRSPRLRAQRTPVTTLMASEGSSGRSERILLKCAPSKHGAPGGTFVETYFALNAAAAAASSDIVWRMCGDKLVYFGHVYIHTAGLFCISVTGVPCERNSELADWWRINCRALSWRRSAAGLSCGICI
jgi:hypothetical protein